MDAEAVWGGALAYIKNKVPNQVLDTWFLPLRLQGFEGSTARVEVPNRFFGEWLRQHHEGLISEALGTVLGKGGIGITYVTKGGDGPSQSSTPPSMAKATLSGRTRRAQLNPRYTFENFVVGANSQFAHAASMAVAEAPARAYNPLFIYGGVGLGKTHLLNAIGNRTAERSTLQATYVTTEQFTNEVINSIRYDKMIDLRRRYRSIDMLLVDDVQFLAGKERTQEEFFHTFNTLYEVGKQIVLSSDRFPKEMPDIEERLRSRFGWGLIADLQAPDVETRVAIIRKKSEDEGIGLPEDVVQFLSVSVKNNVRELEGSLVRLGAYSSLIGQPITLDMAKDLLRDIIGSEKKIIAMEDIQEAVADRFHIKISDLRSQRRSKTLVYPRQIAMFLCRELTNASFPEIGRQFGGKDHTTIIHACKQITKLKESDHTLQVTLNSLRDQVTNG